MFSRVSSALLNLSVQKRVWEKEQENRKASEKEEKKKTRRRRWAEKDCGEAVKWTVAEKK